jgi:DNA-binding transcriptional LysR family regulator
MARIMRQPCRAAKRRCAKPPSPFGMAATITPMKLDPVSLRLFVAVMEESAIARAAAREHIAPSAASRRLAELEQQLQVELFTRSNRGMQPTPAAYALLNLARGVLHDLDGIGLQMRDYANGLRGQVRLVANLSAITQFLPGELQAFMARHPGVQVRLQEQISSAIARAVAENAADVGILNAGDYGTQLRLLPYRNDELVLAVPIGHALARRKRVQLAEALPYPLVVTHPGSAIHQQLQRAAVDAGLPLQLRMQVTGYDALCLMVAAGMGLGVLPRRSAQLYQSAVAIRLLHLDEPWAQRQLMLCLRADEAPSGVARLLIEHLQQDPESAA